jgi:SAM-dependent methyltransferase
VDIHPEARSYQGVAAIYQRARPSYPAAAISRLADALDIRPGRRVVDIGAGTGKLTRLLVDTGAEVVAVEPLPAMREQCAAVLPGIEILAGTAERLPLADGSADVIVAGQAWHWFDARAALAECARVLRPSGGLGLIWNDYDRTVPWARRFADAYRRRAADGPRHSDGAWRRAFDGLAGWTPLEQALVPNLHRTTRTGVIERALSSSWVAALPPDAQAEVAGEVEAILDADPATAGRTDIDLPYVTEVYWCRRL